MKPTNFSKYLTDFLLRYLPHERGASTNTIHSYRDTFTLYLVYMESKGVKAEKLTMESITKENILSFLDWLETKRSCCTSTRNLRLAAIQSFFKYLQYQSSDHLYEYQEIMAINNKKSVKPIMNYLTVEEMKILLQQPDTTKPKGRRDLALLSLMYDTACRVSEVISLTPQCVRLDEPYTVIITGKGNKNRVVPMLEEQLDILKIYMKENGLLRSECLQHPLFTNCWGEKLTRAGVANILDRYVIITGKGNKNRVVPMLEEQLDILKIYMKENGLLRSECLQHPLFTNCWGEKLTRAGVANILDRYIKKAKLLHPTLMKGKISCHSLRHSKAMHLLQAGVNLVYIRDILGHVNVQTTEIYARADSKVKREAIEKAYIKVVQEVDTKPMWQGNEKLMDFLKSF